ncbi:MAG TPA: glycosyltransferase [Micromonospora sp.]|nr:glycosyltransferase [Micromonospora sp.]
MVDDTGRRRVVVVSADIGAGHDAAAAELASRLGEQGLRVDRLNVLSLLPRPLHIAVRETYRNMLRWLPWSYQAIFTISGRSRLYPALIRAVTRPAARRMLDWLPPDTGIIVTTWPFANQLLGPLRRDGRIPAPVITYVTDFVVHPTWVSPGVDIYCVIHHEALQQAKTNGASDVRVVCPLVSARFSQSDLSRRQARRRFGLPEEGRLALIVAGSWGAGKIARTAAEVLATGCAQPVIVCGRNEKLHRQLRRFPGYVLGWVDDMPSLMRAVDVLVENAGGLTCQESFAAGLSTVTYRPLPGHGKANALILARAGLTHYVPSANRLKPMLTELMAQGAAAPAAPSGIDMAAVVTEVCRQAERRSLPSP